MRLGVLCEGDSISQRFLLPMAGTRPPFPPRGGLCLRLVVRFEGVDPRTACRVCPSYTASGTSVEPNALAWRAIAFTFRSRYWASYSSMPCGTEAVPCVNRL